MASRAIFGILSLQMILSLILSLVLRLDSPQNIEMLVFGSLASGLNFAALAIFYVFIFQKKRVALGIFIVVIKYAILGFLLWNFLTQMSGSKASFLIGLVLNPIAIVFFALFNANKTIKK